MLWSGVTKCVCLFVCSFSIVYIRLKFCPSKNIYIIKKLKINKSENANLGKMVILHQNKFAKRVLEAIWTKI